MPQTETITDEPWVEVVRQKVAGIRFGSVQITVHDGRVTQVESLEKTRFSPVKETSANGSRSRASEE